MAPARLVKQVALSESASASSSASNSSRTSWPTCGQACWTRWSAPDDPTKKGELVYLRESANNQGVRALIDDEQTILSAIR
jgi:hypothetical protein